MSRKKIWIILYIVLLLYAVLAVWPRSPKVASNSLIIAQNERPLLIAHGGGNKEFPDNTLEAFYHAYSIDPFVMMETDVSLTKDGVIILSHDTTLDRKTTLQNAPIIDINYADLISQQIDFNYHNEVSPKSNGFNVSGELIPYRDYLGNTKTPLDVVYPEGVVARHDTLFLATTLRELIIAFPNNPINVEIKQSGETGLLALTKVIELLDELDSEYNTYSRIVLASFHKEVFHQFKVYQRTTHPQLLYSPEASSVTTLFILHLLRLDVFYSDRVSVFQLPMSQLGLNLATKSLVNTLHKHNIAVHYWTIDDPDDMRHLISIGADGIMTNIPSLLRQVLDE